MAKETRPRYEYGKIPEPGKGQVALNGGHTELFLKKLFQFPKVREDAGLLTMAAVYELLQSKTVAEAEDQAARLFQDPDVALELADKLFQAQESWISLYEVVTTSSDGKENTELHSFVDFHVILEQGSDELLQNCLDFMKQELRQPISILNSGTGFLSQYKKQIDEGQTQFQEKFDRNLRGIKDGINRFFDITNLLDDEWPELVARIGKVLRELVQWATQLQQEYAQSDDPELKKLPAVQFDVVRIMREKYLLGKRPAEETGGKSNINYDLFYNFLEERADAEQAQNLAFYDEMRQLCTAFYDLHRFLNDNKIKSFYEDRIDIIGQANSEKYQQMIINAGLFKQELEHILFGLDGGTNTPEANPPQAT